MTDQELIAEQEEIKKLSKEFKFNIELDTSSDRVMYLKFSDKRQYRLEHPGALKAAELFARDTDSIASDCLKYFINNCILPVADSGTKVLNSENLDINETFELWLPFAWRFLRRGTCIAT